WSVPIRTLVLQPPDTEGMVHGQLGIGAGIVHDSDSATEYRECAWKARFVSELKHDFELIETMRASRSDGCRYLERHLQRLQASAQCFGFVCDLSAILQRLNVACAQLPDGLHRLRLTLAQDGVIALNSAPLQLDLKPVIDPVKVLLAVQPLVGDALLLRHKTTQRAAYDLAWREAEAQGAFDVLFFNQRGELTEGARSNVLLQLNGVWYTPPLSCGVLPGVMRSVLLDDPAWQVQQRCLSRADLQAAQQVVLCNALRGVLPARIYVGDASDVADMVSSGR
ncbi:MAG: aminotransferase class IV, partial [Herbaspirillum sp.]